MHAKLFLLFSVIVALAVLAYVLFYISTKFIKLWREAINEDINNEEF